MSTITYFASIDLAVWQDQELISEIAPLIFTCKALYNQLTPTINRNELIVYHMQYWQYIHRNDIIMTKEINPLIEYLFGESNKVDLTIAIEHTENISLIKELLENALIYANYIYDALDDFDFASYFVKNFDVTDDQIDRIIELHYESFNKSHREVYLHQHIKSFSAICKYYSLNTVKELTAGRTNCQLIIDDDSISEMDDEIIRHCLGESIVQFTDNAMVNLYGKYSADLMQIANTDHLSNSYNVILNEIVRHDNIRSFKKFIKRTSYSALLVYIRNK